MRAESRWGLRPRVALRGRGACRGFGKRFAAGEQFIAFSSRAGGGTGRRGPAQRRCSPRQPRGLGARRAETSGNTRPRPRARAALRAVPQPPRPRLGAAAAQRRAAAAGGRAGSRARAGRGGARAAGWARRGAGGGRRPERAREVRQREPRPGRAAAGGRAPRWCPQFAAIPAGGNHLLALWEGRRPPNLPPLAPPYLLFCLLSRGVFPFPLAPQRHPSMSPAARAKARRERAVWGERASGRCCGARCGGLRDRGVVGGRRRRECSFL